jgi:hypothetical protein
VVLCGFVRKNTEMGFYVVLSERIPGVGFCPKKYREWGFMWIFFGRIAGKGVCPEKY